jgi:hypothetical protein
MKIKDKDKILEEVIKSVWSSLVSHLPYTYQKSSEGKIFHKKCVREYSVIIDKLSKLL